MFSKPPVNVHEAERYAAGFLGAALLAQALRPLRPWGLFWAACLFYRAYTGNCRGYQMCGLRTRKLSGPA